MVRPSVVFELGIHHISRPLYSLPAAADSRRNSEVRVMLVDPEVGFVHHYRDCTNDYEYELDCDMASFVLDTRLVDVGYIPTLKKNVQSALNTALNLSGPSSFAGT